MDEGKRMEEEKEIGCLILDGKMDLVSESLRLHVA